MGEHTDLMDRSDAVNVIAASLEGGIRQRRGLRITLLSLATTILVFGAAVAGTFGYLMLASG